MFVVRSSPFAILLSTFGEKDGDRRTTCHCSIAQQASGNRPSLGAFPSSASFCRPCLTYLRRLVSSREFSAHRRGVRLLGTNRPQAILRVSAASAEYHTAAGVLFANETCSLSGSDYMLKRWEAFTRFNVEAPFRAKFLGTPLSLTMCRMTVAPKCRYRRARAKVKLERCTTISAGLAACGAVREAKSQVKPAAVKTAALHVKFVSLADCTST